jgi:hypothetical protein
MTAHIHRLGDPATHFFLTRSVARVMGVNLSEAMAAKDLTAAEYAEMVNRCRQCALVTTCQNWLGEKRTRPAAAPEHCCNADVLRRLAQQVHA